jgi:hypothetical protein
MTEIKAPRGPCAMAVMGKASVPGRAETRLIPEIGAANAALLNTAFLKHITTNSVHANIEVPIAGYVAYGPAGTEQCFRDPVSQQVSLMGCSLADFDECLGIAVLQAALRRPTPPLEILDAPHSALLSDSPPSARASRGLRRSL